MKKIAILQSNYVPWKGYFDLIAAVDEFILYDDMQFTKNDWRNRNKIKTPSGAKWLSIPVGQNINRRIRDVMLVDSHWQLKHWRTLELNYRRSAHFEEIEAWLAPLYNDHEYQNLSALNHMFISSICNYLGIKTQISRSWDYHLIDGKTERLSNICQQAGATDYISGPSAKEYIDEKCFVDAGIRLSWFDYKGYPEYPQLWGEFIHDVSILDLLFNCGGGSPKFMRYVNK